jgi:hypothetical protein
MNADLKRIRTAAETDVLQRFADIEDSLPGNAATHADRRTRMALFEREGCPTACGAMEIHRSAHACAPDRADRRNRWRG